MPSRHHYGWRPSLPDFRDAVFAVSPGAFSALPPSIDLAETTPALRPPATPPWDQGTLGSCGPNSACLDIVFAAMRQQGLTDCPMPSRLFVYYVTRWLMGTIGSDSGVDNRTMLKALSNYGWCDESLWPYNVSRFREKPPPAAFSQAVGRRISQYLSVPQSLEQMKACLAGGDPFIYGFSVYSNLETATVEHTGVVPMPSGPQLGGHDVLIVGYSDVTRGNWPANHFKFQNSWGQWGDRGFGYMPYAYATNPRMSGDFWTVRHSSLPAPTPTPVPPDPPTPPPGPAPEVPTIVVTTPGVYVLRGTADLEEAARNRTGRAADSHSSDLQRTAERPEEHEPSADDPPRPHGRRSGGGNAGGRSRRSRTRPEAES